jgi:hypothetical protein
MQPASILGSRGLTIDVACIDLGSRGLTIDVACIDLGKRGLTVDAGCMDLIEQWLGLTAARVTIDAHDINSTAPLLKGGGQAILPVLSLVARENGQTGLSVFHYF